MIRIGLVGDFDRGVLAHRAIPLALELAAASASVALRYEWVPTETIAADARLSSTFDGLWCVPASPYRSQEGALAAIRIARETPLPFLGTCGGFQHAILEYARNVLGWSDAVHGEEAPAGGGRAVIAELRCALVEEQDEVRLIAGTKIADAYGTLDIREGYHCRYGINLEFASLLERGPLRATAHDHNGEIRAVELDGHPFFAATLFQPERAALTGQRAPLVDAFVNACR